MTATVRSEPPADAFSVAFRAELLRALDARGRADVRAAGALHHVEPGRRLMQPGEPADTLFVVTRGVMRLEESGAPAAGRPRREVGVGEAFGHEALVPFAVRHAHAVAVETACVLELPAGVLRRVLVRAGLSELLVKAETRARRAEWRAAFARTALGALPPRELDALVRAVVEIPRAPGEELEDNVRRGGVWFVAGGLFELTDCSDERPERRPLYAARGDFIGFMTSEGGTRLRSRALGEALALLVASDALTRIKARHPAVIAALERVSAAREAKQRRTFGAVARPATRHAGDEMARLGGASSLLAIDLARCTHCGHCAATCAASHGSSRFERRGEKVSVTLRNAETAVARPLLFPNACQHCREPACLEPCPTGAIRRLPTGAVELEGALCTGCGACAKACPWEAIRMAPRTPASLDQSSDVAVKCDLCSAYDGPECVSACPTDAIFRLDPRRDVVEVRAIVGKRAETQPRPRERRGPSWGALLLFGVIPPLVALDRTLPAGGAHGARYAAGVLGALLVLFLCAHSGVKRVARLRRWVRRTLGRSEAVSTVAPLVTFHGATGVAAAASVLLHAGYSASGGVTGALFLAFWSVAASGGLGALAYRFLPERLARLERRSGLPEDDPIRREALFDRFHDALSDAPSVKKELVRGLLLPYASSLLGAVALVARGRTLAAEETALRSRIERALGGRTSKRLSGIEPLVRTAVEMRALGAARLVRGALRVWLPLHLVLSALVVVLLALHVAGALR